MKNKQEVIEVILGELDYQKMVPTDVRLNNRALAERIEILLRLRIAPLMVREFPDEEMKDLLDLIPYKEGLFWRIKCLIGERPSEKAREFPEEEVKHYIYEIADKSYHEYPHLSSDNLEIWVACRLKELKDLLEGQPDHIAEVRKKVEQDKTKGTCKTCGGSGEIDHMTPRGDEELGIDCPDCKGTGEEKKKYCLRCGVVCSENSVVSCHRNAGEKIGKHRWTDERSGEERRRGEEAKCNKIPIPRGKTLPFGDYIDPYEVDPTEGGWSEDRRSLPDRRKAQAAHSERPELRWG